MIILKEVEPMYRESDHIHITALTQALNVPVSIIYLDRANQDQVTVHNFPEDCASPSINILYRPGHYDIIYKHWDFVLFFFLNIVCFYCETKRVRTLKKSI